ncbi:cupin domain-containing protein [Pacificimonas sp. ICDLI1SI03]
MQKVAAVGAQEGLAEKTLVLFKEPRPDGMSIMYAWFKSNYVLPRHNHDADCAYYILAGSLKMGSQTLGKGDGMFVPAGAGYTYEVGPDGLELLEVRNAAHFNIDFKGNNEGHWDRIAEVYRTKRSDWQSETPPSKNVEPA